MLLALAGAADLVSAVYRQTILQTYAPDEMRGRMQGVFIAVVAGGPRLGDLRAGATASVSSHDALLGRRRHRVRAGRRGRRAARAQLLALRRHRSCRSMTATLDAQARPARPSRSPRHSVTGMTMSGAQFPIAAGEHAATIAAVGAGLRTYTVDGVDVTCRYGADDAGAEVLRHHARAVAQPHPRRAATRSTATRSSSALTEPAAGNAIHGLGRWARWVPVAHTASSVTLRLDVVPQNGYPFEVRVDVTFALSTRRPGCA